MLAGRSVIKAAPPTLTIGRAAFGLLVGSLLGAALIQLSGFLPALVFERDEFLSQWRPSDTQVMAILFAATWIVFAASLVVFGIPPWWICHRLGWRGARTALAVGFFATFSVSLTLNGPQLIFGGSEGAYGARGGMSITEGTPHGLYPALWESLEFALLGAAVGGLVWRLAYRGPTVRWDIIPGRERPRV